MANIDDAENSLILELGNVAGYIRRVKGKVVQVGGYNRKGDSGIPGGNPFSNKVRSAQDSRKESEKVIASLRAAHEKQAGLSGGALVQALRNAADAHEADDSEVARLLRIEADRIEAKRTQRYGAAALSGAEDAMVVELAGLVDVKQYFRRSKTGKSVSVRSHKRHVKGSLLNPGDVVKDTFGRQKTVANAGPTGVTFKDGSSGQPNASFEVVQPAKVDLMNDPHREAADSVPEFTAGTSRSRASQRQGRDAAALKRAGFPGSEGSKVPAGSARGFVGGGELSDEEYQAHTKHIEEEISKAMSEGKATDKQFAVDISTGVWDYDRTLLHKQIVDAMWDAGAANVPNEGKAMISGGLGGAGKSTVLKLVPGAEKGNYFTINSDDVKEHIANNHPEMIPEAGDLSPLERVALIHEESSHIADLLAARAYAEKKNMIWDITMASTRSVQKRISDLRANGYTDIKGVFVDIDVETSVSRALARHRRGMEDFRKGKGQGGRYVPPHIIRLNRSDRSSSANRETFDTLREQFDSWDLYNNNVDGRAPVKEGSSTGAGGSGTAASSVSNDPLVNRAALSHLDSADKALTLALSGM